VDLVRRQAELKYLDETSRKELNCAVEELAAGDETVPDAEAIAEAERLYEEVRARIEALGPVNAQAMEEFQEAQQRQDFLSAQRQDLLDSIRDTEKAIGYRRGFAAEIQGSFRAHQRELPRGVPDAVRRRQGEMRLTDETNLADSGIDIVASPPGKKLQNVLLLSGGEKALAAVALLMAIFRYQPSPFCILDEVDAPLDEANIAADAAAARRCRPETQFIVITHSKKTMEAARRCMA
jgi:chromosome segregation protein